MKTAKETTITKKNGQQKELFGRTFKIVKNGLDEAEIASFLRELIEQNTDLVAKLEHLDSLNKLAENKVIEAQNEAEGIRSEIEQTARDTASAIIAEANEAAAKTAKEKIEETERNVEAIKASAEEEANRIRAEASRKAGRLEIKVRATAEKETRAKREQLKKYYRQVYKELVANLDGFVETTNQLTESVSVELPGVEQAQPVVEPIRIILPRNRFVTGFLQYLSRLFKTLARWLRNGYSAVSWIFEPEIRRVRKAASRLKERLPRIRLTN